MKQLLAKFGVTSEKGCRCDERAAEMDARGCDWCEENIDTIVGWLAEEAEKRGWNWAFSPIAARTLVRWAIRRARKAEAKTRAEAKTKAVACVDIEAAVAEWRQLSGTVREPALTVPLLEVCEVCSGFGDGETVAQCVKLSTFECPQGKWRTDTRPGVLAVSSAFSRRGGGMCSWRQMVERLAERGFSVTTYSDGEPVIDVPGVRHLSGRVRAVGKVIEARAPAAVMCSNEMARWVVPACERLGVPAIVYVQFWRGIAECRLANLAAIDGDPSAVRTSPFAAVLRQAAAIVPNSEYTGERVAAMTGLAVTEPVRPTVTVKGTSEVERRYVMCPSAQQWKGADVFFALAETHPDIPFLLLAGDAYSSSELAERGDGIPNVEVRRGWVDDMAAVYAGARAVFIGTETCETFSRVAAEARACGVPILALGAGNLPNIVRGDGGVCVPRGATFKKWRRAFERVLEMRPEPTDEFCRDDRERMVGIVNEHRNLPEVYVPCPRAPGIRAAVTHLRRVLGVTTVDWSAGAEAYAGAAAVLSPWMVRDEVTAAGKPTLLWWHSHLAQMDTSRVEIQRLVDELGGVGPPHGVAFGTEADAAVWGLVHPGRAWHVPACLHVQVSRHEKTGGVFLPGPYGPRKNVTTALAACRLAGRTAHMTGEVLKHPEITELMVALGVDSHVHECETVDDVRKVAGACDMALMLSTAETYCYAAAECIMAGTPVLAPVAVPAVRPGPWTVVDPTDAEAVAGLLRPVDWHAEQLASLREVADERAAVAQANLLQWLETVR